jgi:hypothetical protein
METGGNPSDDCGMETRYANRFIGLKGSEVNTASQKKTMVQELHSHTMVIVEPGVHQA